MNDSPWIWVVGGIAQLLFSSRILLQWIKTERARKVVSPTLFWKFSLAASFLLFVYGWLRDDFPIMLGQVISYFVYIRNLKLKGAWGEFPLTLRLLLVALPVIILIYGYNNNHQDLADLLFNADIPIRLLIWGVIAQLMFTARFVYQWYYSERVGKSVLPIGFWMLSLVGGCMLLFYSFLRKDPVYFIGQLSGIFVYARNLMIYKKYGSA